MSDETDKKVTPPGPKTTVLKKTVKVKEHPNAHKYPGRHTMDYMQAQLRFISSLTDEQRNLAEANLLLQDPDAVEAFIKTVEVKDVIGVKMDMLEIRGKGDFTLDAWDPRKKVDVTLSPFELDEARAMGLLEILYRDEKPYGVSETKEITVTIVDHRETEKKEPPAPAQH